MSSCKCGFCHLHVHSEYSLLDGANRLKDLAERSAALDIPALALTDHGVMYGAVDHYLQCNKVGIKPIIGCEVYVAPRRHTDRDPQLDGQKNTSHLTLWARNQTGYRNLVKLTTRAHLDGFYYKPRVDHELLAQHAEGIICGSACLGGEIPRFLATARFDEAVARAEKYREIFGPENFFLELMDHGIDLQKLVNEGLIKIHERTGIPLLVTNDVHFLQAQDTEMHRILVCIGTKSTVDNSALEYGPDLYLKSPEEMYQRFSHVPEALENTLRIADMVDLKLDLDVPHFPDFEVPPGHDLTSYLKELCVQRFPQRYPTGHPRRAEAEKRMEYELGVIIDKGYPGYFLVVQDFINWSKQQGILAGCRGSAAGCLVSYVLGITNLDPLPYGLLFERFLNPERISTPDIDVDLPDRRRDEVLNYVTNRYGADHVAQIITFGTLAARAAVRDTARAMGLELALADKVAKLLPPMKTRIAESLENIAELKELYDNDPRVHKLIDTAMQIEGMTRHASRHACGVVIGKLPLDLMVPLENVDGKIVTQYHAKSLEKMGLVKMDLLGLQNNTVISETVDLVRQRHGVEIDLEGLDLNDARVYEMLARGDSGSIFQLESSGMRDLLRQLRPESLEHIMVLISLYRPGPMQEIPKYIQSRHSGQASYLHPLLEPITQETYGIFVYQEQVMRAAQALAGFSGAQADHMRGAISKKNQEEMEKLKVLFVEGSIANGVPKKTATQLWDRITVFASYAFNKSHAAYYALVAYWTAYLKAHYLPEFMACKMTSVLGNQDKLLAVMDDARHHGLNILPPDVNQSNNDFTVVDEGIRFGLVAIKNVGEGPVRAILEARAEDGPFSSLFDFCRRVPVRTCPRATIEFLIRAGAFDSLHPNRQAMLQALPGAVEAGQRLQQENASGQMGLFGDTSPTRASTLYDILPVVEDVSLDDRLNWERELLSHFLSDHPLNPYRAFLESVTLPLASINEPGSTLADSSRIKIGGHIYNLNRRTSKNGNAYATFMLEDLTGTIEVMAFGETCDNCQHVMIEGARVLIQGRVMMETGRRGNNQANDEEGGAQDAEATLRKIRVESMEDLMDQAAAWQPPPMVPAAVTGALPTGESAEIAGAGVRQSATYGTNGNGLPAQNGKGNGNGHGTSPRPHAVPALPTQVTTATAGQAAAGVGEPIHLYLTEPEADKMLSRIWNLCRDYRGNTPLFLHIQREHETVQLRVSPAYFIDAESDFLIEAKRILGPERVELGMGGAF